MIKKDITLIELSKLKPHWKQIEALSGVSPTIISHYLSGRKKPSEAQLAKITNGVGLYCKQFEGINIVNE
jgi:transcriptional regulator with XRE-family HTH domain